MVIQIDMTFYTFLTDVLSYWFLMKAYLLMVSMTSLKRILEVRV